MRDGFICVAAGTPKIRVADCRYNAEQIFTMMREADKQGVKILALPELAEFLLLHLESAGRTRLRTAPLALADLTRRCGRSRRSATPWPLCVWTR